MMSHLTLPIHGYISVLVHVTYASVNTLEVERDRVRNSVKKSLSSIQRLNIFVIVTVNEYLVFFNAVFTIVCFMYVHSFHYFVLSFLRGNNVFNRQKEMEVQQKILFCQ